MFLVISVYFNSRIILPNSGTFTPGHCIYIYIYTYTHSVSRLVDIAAGGDFVGLCDQKIHINVRPILDSYGVMTT